MTPPDNGPSMLRILAAERFATAIQPLLKIPHEMATFQDQADETITPMLRNTDVFVSSVFRSEWASPIMPLRLIQGIGAGVDGIDLAAVPAGCAVCNVYGHGSSVAEYVFMTMAMLTRAVVSQDRALRRGKWGDGVMRTALAGKKLGVLGLGHIGAEVVRWGRFAEMEVRGLTRRPTADRAAGLGLGRIGDFGELDSLLAWADFVVVAIPHTAETTGLIGAEELGRMGSATYLVNVARGPVVDEEALYSALKRREIAGAAVDVWYRYPAGLDKIEPPATFPFHELDNIIMTPHNSGYTDRTMAFRFAFIAANIGRLAGGRPLENLVYPRRSPSSSGKE